MLLQAARLLLHSLASLSHPIPTELLQCLRDTVTSTIKDFEVGSWSPAVTQRQHHAAQLPPRAVCREWHPYCGHQGFQASGECMCLLVGTVKRTGQGPE